MVSDTIFDDFMLIFLRFWGFSPPQAGKFLPPLKLATHLTWPPGEKNSFPLINKLASQLKWVTTVVKTKPKILLKLTSKTQAKFPKFVRKYKPPRHFLEIENSKY